jgi:GNAT superfamily N-acetyltransferase
MSIVGTVRPLREYPQLCAFFAEAFKQEWTEWYGPGGRGDADADVQSYANPLGELPVGVVALDAEQRPLGLAALKSVSIESHKHLTPWATAGFVLPELRRQGVGAQLLAGVFVEARRLGFPCVYCATATAGSLLAREGWQFMEAVLQDGHSLQVFCKAVPSNLG